MGSLWKRLRACQEDEGFGLVETVVALTIAGFAFSTLAIALIGGARTSTLAQQNQQAGDLLSQTVEQSRALGYAAVAMRSTDLDAGEATRSPSISSCQCYNPSDDSTSGAGVEPLATTDAAGGIYPHSSSVSQNGLTFTVRQYVTAPTDSTGASYKRLTVLVSWSSLGRGHLRNYSTIVASTKRGLPLPDYKFTAVGGGLSQCRNPGSEVVYGFNVKNNGARDEWLLSSSGDGSWSYFADTNGSGSYDVGDTALSPAATGLMEPTAGLTLFAVTTMPSGAAQVPPYTWNTVFRATSAAQPSYFSELTATTGVFTTACGGIPASPTPTPTPTPTSTAPTAPAQPVDCPAVSGSATPSAPGGTLVRYYLHNPSYPSNTNASLDMPIVRDGGTPPTGSSLYAYSQDYSSQAGRWLGYGTGSTAAEQATWTYQMPSASTLKGTGSVKLWLTQDAASISVIPPLQVRLDLLNSDGSFSSTLATATHGTSSSGSCSGMRAVNLDLGSFTGSGTVIAANARFRLTVRLTGGSGVHLAYGTALYPAEMQLPYKAGLG